MDTQALETTNRSYILPSTRTIAQSALHFHQGGKKNGNKLCKLQTDGAENPFFFYFAISILLSLHRSFSLFKISYFEIAPQLDCFSYSALVL